MQKPDNNKILIMLIVSILIVLTFTSMSILWSRSLKSESNIDKSNYWENTGTFNKPESYPEEVVVEEIIEDEEESIESLFIDKPLETLKEWETYYHKSLGITITNYVPDSSLYVSERSVEVFFPYDGNYEARDVVMHIRNSSYQYEGYPGDTEPSEYNPKRMSPIIVAGEEYVFERHTVGDGFNGVASFGSGYYIYPRNLEIIVNYSETSYDPEFCDDEYADLGGCPEKAYSISTPVEQLTNSRKIIKSIKFD